MWLPLACPLLGTWSANQACTLTGNRTDNPLVLRLVLNPLSNTSQGRSCEIYSICCLIPIKVNEPSLFQTKWLKVFVLFYHKSLQYIILRDERQISPWPWFCNIIPFPKVLLFLKSKCWNLSWRKNNYSICRGAFENDEKVNLHTCEKNITDHFPLSYFPLQCFTKINNLVSRGLFLVTSHITISHKWLASFIIIVTTFWEITMYWIRHHASCFIFISLITLILLRYRH